MTRYSNTTKTQYYIKMMMCLTMFNVNISGGCSIDHSQQLSFASFVFQEQGHSLQDERHKRH
ncbi:hypothetical protein I4U23_022659 [Adineta vaga]|nr:hypothetical protein I4U23_022659 [Adineta vaga]